MPVDPNAQFRCHVDVKPTKKLTTILAAVAGGIVLLCCGGLGLTAIFSKAEKRQAEKVLSEDELRKAKSDDVVPAEALYRTFSGNEVAGDEKYGGKTIIVEGTVGSIEKGAFGSGTRIRLVDGRGSNIVDCTMSDGAKGVASLIRGSYVRVQGVCRGKKGFGVSDVAVEDCTFTMMNR